MHTVRLEDAACASRRRRAWASMQPTERVTLRLPVQDLQELDLYISLGHGTSRSEAIRIAIREWLDQARAKAIAKAQQMEQVRALAGGALKADELSRK